MIAFTFGELEPGPSVQYFSHCSYQSAHAGMVRVLGLI